MLFYSDSCSFIFYTSTHSCMTKLKMLLALSWWLHTSISYLCLSLCSGVQVNSPYLEEHLMHMIKQDQSKVHNMDLLWRYYEKNRNFGKAAHVLARLADMHRFGCSSKMPTPQHATHLHGKLAPPTQTPSASVYVIFNLLKNNLEKVPCCLHSDHVARRSHWSSVWSTSLEPSCLRRVHPPSQLRHLMESSSMSWKRRWR